MMEVIMVYSESRYHPAHRRQANDMRNKKRVSKIERIIRSMPSPGVENTFEYCPCCNLYTHLRFRKVFLGKIEVSTSCCGRVRGYLDFPQYARKWKDRKVYLAWRNR